MTVALRFNTYTFPMNDLSFNTNFGDLNARADRLPGMDGGFDIYGTAPAPSAIGRVNVNYVLYVEEEKTRYAVSDDLEAMSLARDAVKAMAGWGKRKLFVTPYTAATPRFCDARINNISIPENPSDCLKSRLMPVRIIFQVDVPFWFTIGTEAWSWGDGTTWGSGAKWGGSVTPQACAGVETAITETIGGTAYTLPRLTISCGAGQSASNIIIQRIAGGVVVDQVEWNDTLVAGDSLEINCRARSVQKNGSNAYSSAFDFLYEEWFKLEPGDNSLKVLMANPSDACSVTLRYYIAYK